MSKFNLNFTTVKFNQICMHAYYNVFIVYLYMPILCARSYLINCWTVQENQIRLLLYINCSRVFNWVKRFVNTHVCCLIYQHVFSIIVLADFIVEIFCKKSFSNQNKRNKYMTGITTFIGIHKRRRYVFKE